MFKGSKFYINLLLFSLLLSTVSLFYLYCKAGTSEEFFELLTAIAFQLFILFSAKTNFDMYYKNKIKIMRNHNVILVAIALIKLFCFAVFYTVIYIMWLIFIGEISKGIVVTILTILFIISIPFVLKNNERNDYYD
jgi:hypothetical protein